MRLVLALCLVLALLFWSKPLAKASSVGCDFVDQAHFCKRFIENSVAGPLAERLANFPHWENKPPVQAAAEDLVYPNWMAGTWKVTSTLIEQVAPLAPNIVTPGFESNRRYLNQPVSFTVRFVPLPSVPSKLLPRVKVQTAIVADRGFNGLNLARAYLGDPALRAALTADAFAPLTLSRRSLSQSRSKFSQPSSDFTAWCTSAGLSGRWSND